MDSVLHCQCNFHFFNLLIYLEKAVLMWLSYIYLSCVNFKMVAFHYKTN